MGAFACESGWLEIVRRQEEAADVAQFSRKDAMALGLEIVRLAGEVYHGAAAVCILEDGMVVFSFKMEGTTLENEWWMRRKLAAARLTGVSSLRAYLEIEADLRPPLLNETAFAACGGCVGLRVDGAARVQVLVSGLRHQEDHQVIFDALCSQYGLCAPSLVKP